jgi:capsular exopolysaccharide synthesis family protein
MRVVDSLPNMKVEYISKGRFRTRNLYKESPITITPEYIATEAYGIDFKIKLGLDGSVEITEDDNILGDDFKVRGRIGEPIRHNLFFITIYDNESTYSGSDLYFRFRSKEGLTSDFANRIGLNFITEGSSVLEIALASETPARDVDFINKLCEVYLISNLERKNDAATRTIEFIDKQLAFVSDSLTRSQDQLTEFRKKNNIINVQTFSEELIQKATVYDGELVQMKLRESYLNYLSKYIKSNLDDGSIVAPTSLGLNEPLLMELINRINDLILRKNEITEKNLYYAKYTREITSLKSAINEVVRNMQVSQNIEKSDLDARLSILKDEIGKLPEKELTMIGIERNYRMNDSYYTLFLQKRAEAQILKASNTPDNNILDKARTTSVTNSADRSRTTMMFLVLGLLIPTIFVILKQMMNSTIRSNKDVIKYCSFPLIGMVRHTTTESPYIVANNPRSSFTEMFRIIRTRIEFLVKRKTDITIMVTSSESGDGKTYFCINLACIYAMASQKTLLIDMDIRKPSVFSRLGCSNALGLSNYLAGQCDLDEIIVRPEGAEFDFITAGTVPPNAGELIRSANLASMMTELRRRYSFIVVDTSPIGVVADAYSFAALSDVNLFVIRNEKTNKNFVRNLTTQLQADKVNEFYAILNDINIDSSSYSSYYSKRYTYGNRRNYSYGGYGDYGYGYGYGYGSSGSGKKKKNDSSGNYFQYYTDDIKEI